MAINFKAIEKFLIQVEGHPAMTGYIPVIRKSDGRGKNYVGKNITTDPSVPYQVGGDPSLFTAMGVSGVTCATGFDTGQCSLDTALTSYNIPSDICKKLAPYFLVKASAALIALYHQPVTLTSQEADQINEGVHYAYLSQVIAAYNRCSPVTFFDNIPSPAQAVIMSLSYQLGVRGAQTKRPDVWGALVSGQWETAASLLSDGHWSAYTGRRNMEGALLRTI
jgi:hypothetical protein